MLGLRLIFLPPVHPVVPGCRYTRRAPALPVADPCSPDCCLYPDGCFRVEQASGSAALLPSSPVLNPRLPGACEDRLGCVEGKKQWDSWLDSQVSLDGS